MFMAAFLSLLLLGTSTSAASQKNQELVLRRQVSLFYKHFSNGRYDLMWEMTSSNFKKENDNNKKAYIEHLRKAAGLKAKVQIKSISIDVVKQRATVNLILKLWSSREKVWAEQEERNFWVFENGRWRFDYSIEAH